MSNSSHIVLVILFYSLSISSLFAWTNQLTELSGDNDENDLISHVDYLPRYRKSNVNFLITKIEYHPKKMVLHFRYIAEDNTPVIFYGKNNTHAWRLETPKRPGTQSLKKQAGIQNIRINNRLKMRALADDNQASYTPKKGDIISCEIHVEKMPHFIKVTNLAGGDVKNNTDRFSCTDLMIKSAENRTLGTSKQMDILISNFYQEFKYIRYPNIKEVASLKQGNRLTTQNKGSQTTVGTPIKNSMKPIDYMPKMLNSIQDLQCLERVILKNVYFGENSAELTKRVQAMRTINVVVTYLKRYPNAKIVLHGHTDVFGDPYQNLVLSKQRVLTIKRLIKQRGIAVNRIITLYHGGSQPLPRYKDGGSSNRRVEVELICDK